VREAGPGTSECVGDIEPGIDFAATTGFDDGQRRGEGDDGVPIVEDSPGEGADFLGFVIAMELAGPFEPGLDRVEDGVILIFGDGMDQAPEFADQPFPEPRAQPLRIGWARHRFAGAHRRGRCRRRR